MAYLFTSYSPGSPIEKSTFLRTGILEYRQTPVKRSAISLEASSDAAVIIRTCSTRLGDGTSRLARGRHPPGHPSGQAGMWITSPWFSTGAGPRVSPNV
jgi:hypothetical protein